MKHVSMRAVAVTLVDGNLHRHCRAIAPMILGNTPLSARNSTDGETRTRTTLTLAASTGLVLLPGSVHSWSTQMRLAAVPFGTAYPTKSASLNQAQRSVHAVAASARTSLKRVQRHCRTTLPFPRHIRNASTVSTPGLFGVEGLHAPGSDPCLCVHSMRSARC